MVLIGDRPTASKAARVWRRAYEPWGSDSRAQAPWHVVPSVMQRKQPISLLRSLSASIDHRVCVAGSRVVVIGDRPTASKAARVWRHAFEPWGNDSPWAGALGRVAECHVA